MPGWKERKKTKKTSSKLFSTRLLLVQRPSQIVEREGDDDKTKTMWKKSVKIWEMMMGL